MKIKYEGFSLSQYTLLFLLWKSIVWSLRSVHTQLLPNLKLNMII